MKKQTIVMGQDVESLIKLYKREFGADWISSFNTTVNIQIISCDPLRSGACLFSALSSQKTQKP